MDETKSKHKEDQAPGTAPESNNPSQPKGVFARIKAPFNAAFPVMIGYVFLGIPCGILAQQIGLDPLQVFLLSMLFYSGAGQYMIPNMWLAGSPALAIIASVTLVNTRQLLYGASLSRFCHETPKPLSFLFGATVTDESFAVNLGRFSSGEWRVSQATAVNLLCETTWALANTLGVVLGSLLTVPTALASFAMTSIFLCLLFSQKATKSNIAAALVAVLGVFVMQVRRFVGPGYPCWCFGRRCCGHDRFQEGGRSCRGVSLRLSALPARLPFSFAALFPYLPCAEGIFQAGFPRRLPSPAAGIRCPYF